MTVTNHRNSDQTVDAESVTDDEIRAAVYRSLRSVHSAIPAAHDVSALIGALAQEGYRIVKDERQHAS